LLRYNGKKELSNGAVVGEIIVAQKLAVMLHDADRDKTDS